MRRGGLFVTGSGTGVGKTAVAGAIASLLRESGYDVGVMKPVQTGVRIAKGKTASADLDFMRHMAGTRDPDEFSMPYAFRAPQSPLHAAREEKTSIDPDVIVNAYKKLKDPHDVVLVEGAGGLMVPLTETLFWPDLIRALDIPVVLATHAGLGMIHHTISTVMAAEMYGLEMAGIVVVEADRKKHPPVDMKLLERQTGLPVLAFLPYTTSIAGGRREYARFVAHVKKHMDITPIAGFLERKGSEAERKRLEKLDKKNIWHPFTQMREWMEETTLVIDSASGQKLKDVTGNSYYDGHSSYWVNTHGHGDPSLVRTLARQAGRLEHATFLGLSNRPAIELAETLVSISPDSLEKVFYSDNGSTAVEVGMKMAVQYFRQRRENPKPGKTRFLALGNAYHGDTLGAMAVGGIDLYRKIFGPLLADVNFACSPYCYRCPLGRSYPECSLACAAEMEEKLAARHEETAAFVIEPMVQCPGGIITYPPGYLKRVREACHRYDVLMLADEVAVGFGRTGKMFACEHEDVRPDIMAISKSLAAGMLPLAATLASRNIYEAFLGEYEERRTFFHGHTFTGHPLACAVARENLRLFREKEVVYGAEAKGQFLKDRLVRFDNLPAVGDIRHMGMIAGLELVKNRETKEPFSPPLRMGHRVSVAARRRGLIVRPLGDIIVFFPILSARESDIADMASILYDSIAETCHAR